MKEFSYTIKDEQGIHALPAGKIVALAQMFDGRVTMWKDNEAYDLKKLLVVLRAQVKCGESITVRVEGDNEDEFADNLAHAFAEYL